MKQTLTVFLIFLTSYVIGQNDYANLTWQIVPDFDNIGVSNIINYDTDNDGVPEVIYASTEGQRTIIKILDYKNSTFEPSHISPTFEWSIRWMEVYNVPSLGGEKLFALNSNSSDQISVIDLNTLDVEQTITLPSSGSKFKIADTDGDQTAEIVYISSNKVYITDLEGNQLFEKSISYVRDIGIANVDADTDPEIVISGSDGYVLKAADLSEEWVLLGGFGDRIVLQDINGDGQHLIYGAENYDFVRCYDAVLSSPIWELDVDDQISNLHVEDADGDGNYEILVSKYWDSDGINAYDANTQSPLWNMPIMNNGVGDISYGDFDDDGQIEFIYGCGHSNTAEDLLVVFNSFFLTNEWVSLDLSDGMLVNTGYYDDNDESKDLIVGSVSSNSGYDGGLAMVYDGATKELLKEPQSVSNYSDVEAYSMVHYDDNTYLLFLLDDRIYIYNETTENLIINEYYSSDYIQTGEFAYLDAEGAPVLITLHNSGALRIHEFHQNVLTQVWASISANGTANEYQIGNFDTDQDKEIAILSGAVVSVYNAESFLLEKQFNLGSTATATFQIADMDNDGVREVYFTSGGSLLKSINYDTEMPISSLPLIGNPNNHPVKKIKIENLDENPQKEMVLLSDRVLVYNNTLDSLIYSGSVIHNLTSNYARRENLIVEDIDNDQYMEIIAAGRYGVYEYTISVEYLDIILPKVNNFLPIADAQLISTDSDIKIEFSEKMNEADLNIEVKNEMDNSLSFTTDYNLDTDEVTLSPTTLWTGTNEITVTVFNTSTDEAGNPLDGNYNEAPDGTADDFTWSFFTGSGVDDVGPAVSNLSIPIAEIFAGVPLTISGIASDSSDIAVTNVAYIEYSLDAQVGSGQGIAIEPIDEVFDEVVEGFELTISTLNLDSGDHTVYFRAQDLLGNWGEVSTITFNIIEESRTNWTHYSADTYNTSANPESVFNYPISVKYENDYSVGGSTYRLSRPIVVEDYLIFRVGTNQLKCINLQTGADIWEHTFAISDELSSAAYAYGNVYVQLGDHSDSDLACFDLVTGEMIWQTPYSVQWSDLYGPIVAAGVVYIVEGYYDSTIGAYDAFTGNLLWKYDVHGSDNYDNWNPAFYNDTIYGYAERFAAINPANGGVYYELTEDDIPFNWSGWSMNASPIVDTLNHQIILTSRYFVHALSLDTKEIVWSLNSTDYGSFTATPALYDGKLYISTFEQVMRADAATGVVDWQNFDYSKSSQPVVNQNIVAFSGNNKTVIFDLSTMEVANAFTGNSGHLALSEDYLIISSLNQGNLTVLEYNPDQIPLEASLEIVQSISCFGGNDGAVEVNVNGGNGPYTYEWSNLYLPITDSILSGISAGEYTVNIFDVFGNNTTASIILEEPALLDATINTMPDIGMSGTGSVLIEPTGGTPPYSYEWADFPGVDVNQLNNLDAGNYIVTVTDDNDCTKVITAIVEMTINTIEPSLNSKFKVFPNPTSGLLNIQGTNVNFTGTIMVTTADGKQVQFHEKQNLNNISISLKNEPNGIYFISIISQEGKAEFKVLRIH